jgi:hypothetical protein
MDKNAGNKRKAKYLAQFDKTTRNKARRAKRREKYAKSAKCAARKAARQARNVAKGIPRPHRLVEEGKKIERLAKTVALMKENQAQLDALKESPV